MNKKERKYLIRKKFNLSIDSQTLIDYLVFKGITIGKGTIFHDPENIFVDIQRPWMVSIGEYCKITRGVIVLAHDYSRSVLRRKYNEIIGECKKTIIGNNVFIGMNSIILMGTQIGDNCIIGAGSVVSGKFEDNVVIAGNPAKVICTLDQYYARRKSKYIEEAKLYVREYYNKYNILPKKNEMSAFFPLFLERNEDAIKDIWTAWSGDEEEEIIQSFFDSSPMFKDYDDFVTAALHE